MGPLVESLSEPVTWLIILAVFLIIEIATLGLTTIWFAGGALVAFIAAMCQVSLEVQAILFFVVSIGLLCTMRPSTIKRFNGNRAKTNLDSIIGTEGKVTEKIDNFNETGIVLVDGKEWTARAEQEQVIEVGSKVRIVKIVGVKLIVTDRQEEA